MLIQTTGSGPQVRRIAILITTLALTMSGLAIVPAQAKAKVTKPSAPTVSALSSSAPKKGKVNVTITITLPASDGGSKITGSKVTAGGKSCTIAKTKTSCTIKSIKNGKALNVTAKSKNKKGFSSASTSVTYTAGASAWPTTPVATVVADTPGVAAPAPAPALTCAAGGTCVLGDRGPGGGIVYYVDNAGFNCGSGFTATGSPTGGKCKYLEVAPSGWDPPNDWKEYRWATIANRNANVADIEDLADTTAALVSSQIGLGYKNSMAIVNQGNDTTTAAGFVRSYAGGSKGDWYLPTMAELNLLCQWNRGVVQSVTTACANGTLNSGVGAINSEFANTYYWSSSERTQTFVFDILFNGTIPIAGEPIDNKPLLDSIDKRSPTDTVRPVRAF